VQLAAMERGAGQSGEGELSKKRPYGNPANINIKVVTTYWLVVEDTQEK
jgi:hypothetical protein